MFKFKQFTIHQDRCAMKVGTDGVLLGALATIETNAGSGVRVLDIGTGTGLIALMAAQRLSEAGCQDYHIDAVEIDQEAAQQAHENFEASPWASHLQIYPMSLQTYTDSTNTEFVELMVSNPPFYNATLKPEDEARAMARHKDSLPLRQIMLCAQQRLSHSGRLAIIYPTDYDSEVMTEALLARLQPTRIVEILTKVGKPCKRRVAEFMRQGEATPLSRELLSLRNASGDYSNEYRELTTPYYLSLR